MIENMTEVGIKTDLNMLITKNCKKNDTSCNTYLKIIIHYCNKHKNRFTSTKKK